MEKTKPIYIFLLMFIIVLTLIIGGFIGFIVSISFNSNESPIAMIDFNVNEKEGKQHTQPYLSSLMEEKYVYVEDEIKFYGVESSDNDGIIVNYIWEFSDREIPEFGNVITREFEDEGKYEISLTVVDNDGAYKTTYVNLVVNKLPDCRFDLKDEDLFFYFRNSSYIAFNSATLIAF